MPDGNPQPGEVYLAHKDTSPDRDVHGENRRRVGVVERLKNVALCVGRTTHPDTDANTIPSPKNPAIGLSEDGYWQDRHQRPVPRRFWGTEKFAYAGALPDEEKEALLRFWKMTKLLGRTNL